MQVTKNGTKFSFTKCLHLIYILLIQLEPSKWRERERINYLFMCEEIGSEGLKKGSSLPPTSYNTRKKGRKKKDKTKKQSLHLLMQTALFLEFHIQAVS